VALSLALAFAGAFISLSFVVFEWFAHGASVASFAAISDRP
jgi:hypothetical protein